MRPELRFVFDPNVSAENADAKTDAMRHLKAMVEPRAWIQDQISFDGELVKAKKIGDTERKRRHSRWTTLLRDLATP